MAWPDLVAGANAVFLATWGVAANGGTVTLVPQNGSGQVPIDGIIKNPAMEEQLIPGGAAGTGVLRLWVDFKNLSPQPSSGDTILVNGVSYAVGTPDVDIEGGATLKLRKIG